jgi:hypothetical protein
MNLKQIIDYANFLIDESGGAWWKKSDSTVFDMTAAAQMAYDQYAVETCCFPFLATINTAVGQDIYNLKDFSTGSGARIFDPYYLAYDSKTLKQVDRSDVDRANPDWRFLANAEPVNWFKFGEGKIRLYRKPSAIKVITVEGYATPDHGDFELDDDVPDIHVSDHQLLGLWVAILATVRYPGDENQLRASTLYPFWQGGVKAAKSRITKSTSICTSIGSGEDILSRYTPGDFSHF